MFIVYNKQCESSCELLIFGLSLLEWLSQTGQAGDTWSSGGSNLVIAFGCWTKLKTETLGQMDINTCRAVS